MNNYLSPPSVRLPLVYLSLTAATATFSFRLAVHKQEGGDEIAYNWNVHVAVVKRKDETRSCEKWRHLERGTHVPDGRIPQREEVEMVWACAKVGWRWGHEKDITDDSRWKAKSRQTKSEMARRGERGYDQKPDDHWYGKRQKTYVAYVSWPQLAHYEVLNPAQNDILLCNINLIYSFELATDAWLHSGTTTDTPGQKYEIYSFTFTNLNMTPDKSAQT